MIAWRAPADPAEDTGPVGPVAVFALLVLFALAPLMRGGNRNVALIVLEGLALAFLAALLWAPSQRIARPRWRGILLGFLLASPLWLALVYLLPLPQGLWSATPGRADYLPALASAGIVSGDWLPLSLVPDATATSLLAGIPLVAAFLAGFWLRPAQLTLVAKLLFVVAALEVVLGLAQVAGGASSSLYFGGIGGRPFGTFANPNHFANYLAMVLALFIWLGWSAVGRSRNRSFEEHGLSWSTRRLAPWAAGALLLVLGILVSRSRGALLAGLPMALAGLVLAMSATPQRSWRTIAAVAGGAVTLALLMVGFEFVVSRFDVRTFATDASFRGLLAASTLEGAGQFFPWGAGWGTYAPVFPRFQPPTVVGLAHHAHHDYAQLLFEGGLFAVLLMAAFTVLAGARALQLVRNARRLGRLRREEMLCALAGLGLLGFLLHSLVEFNMHIPANAMLAALLAGIFLRPLENGASEERDEAADD